MPTPARPLAWTTLLRMTLALAPIDGALIKMPQWLRSTWLSVISFDVFPEPENRLIPQPTLVGVCAPLSVNRLLRMRLPELPSVTINPSWPLS